MPRTRVDLKAELRLRIGEPNQSGWTADTDGGTWLQSEIHTFLDDAGQRVCEDCIVTATPNDPPLGLIVDQYTFNLRKGIHEYLLPSNLITPLAVFHRNTDGTLRRLDSAPILNLLDDFNPDSTSNLPTHYEVHGRSRFVITEGIATSGSATTVVDSDRSGNATYRFDTGTAVVDDDGAALAANDVVMNVTDGSEALISAVTNQTTLTFAAQAEDTGLTGGRRNNFELGDYYKVVQREYDRPVLLVYPTSSDSNTYTAESFTSSGDSTYAIGNTAGTNQQVAQSFILDRDTAVRGVSLRLGAKTGTPLGSLEVRIETNNAGVPSGTLVDFRCKGSISTITASTWNAIEFPYERAPRLAANTTYWIVARIPTQSDYYASPNNNYYTWQYDSSGGYSGGTAATYDGSSWTAAAANDLLFEVHGVEKNESIIVHYAKYPLSLTAEATVLEIPDFAREALLLDAERRCWLKVMVRDRAEAAAVKYEYEIEKVKRRMQQWKHHPPGRILNTMWRRAGIRGIRYYDSNRYGTLRFS